jgi:RHS repeat-associated protein
MGSPRRWQSPTTAAVATACSVWASVFQGLSAIRRCGSTLAQDGRIAAVALDWQDRYCLDGQRLRLTAGTYGSAGSQYQTEVETFARVTALGSAGAGPASFRVERRDGLIYEYGTTADARVESAGSATPREWALNRIRDRNGNYVDFVYAEDVVNGSHRPLRIDYTGNLQTGAAPYYSVRFTYEARPAGDLPLSYVAGGSVSAPSRLDRIDVVHIATGRAVRSFDLGYGVPGPTGRSRLGTLQECAGGSCFAPTQFSWSSVPAGWSVNMPVTLAVGPYATSIPGDMDGDGFDDLAYHDTTSRQWMVLRGGPYGFQYPAVSTGAGYDSDPGLAIPADLDGDGRRDLLVPGSGNYWQWLRRTSSGSYAYGSTGVLNAAPPGGLVAADVDGDGRDDLVYVKSAGNAIYWRRNHTVHYPAFGAEAVLWNVPVGMRLPGAPFVETAQRFRSMVRSGDFNGDGRVDLLVLAQQGTCGATASCATWVNRWTVLASTGTTLVPQYSFDGNTESLLADFNGDGLTDIGFWSAGSQWQLLLGSGSRGASLAGFVGPFATAAAAPPVGGRAMIIDWDADGRADLLQPTTTGELRYCRSTGTSLESCQAAAIAPGTVPSSPMTLDINGDGYPDLVYATTAVRLHLHHQVPADMLVAVTDGLGAESNFQYAALTDSRVHRAGSGSVFPVRDPVRLGFVVSRITRAGTDGAQQQTYFYEGAKAHAQGRGFLGFARRTASSTTANHVLVEEYLQDPAAVERIGAPVRVTRQQRSGVPLTRTSYTWGRHAYGAGTETRSLAYPASITVERFELDGVRVSSTTTKNTVDVFGTPVQRQVTTTEHAKGSNPGAQHVETTALTGVVNDTSNWCLGRPASTQLTRQHSIAGGTAVTRSFAHGWDYTRCRATQEVVEPSSTSLRVTTDVAYDAYGNVSSVRVTPVGQTARTTTHAWIENGRFLRSRTNPEGHVETIGWDSALALPTATTDPNGLVTSLQYDGLGRTTRLSRPDGTSSTFTRATCGASCLWSNTAYVVGATERGVGDVPIVTAETAFDRYGREVYARQEQPGGAYSFRALRYDSLGQLQQESIPGPCCATPTRWVTHAYDTLGRRISTERPTSQALSTPLVTRWRYDGLAVTETDALGRSTARRHDALGRVLQVVDPAMTDTDYEYDAFGNLVKVRDFADVETLIAYDVRGFRRSLTDPSAGRWTFDYLPLGELRSQTNARGQVTTFSYDRLSRPLTRSEPEGTTTWKWGTSASSRNIGSLASVSSPGFGESYLYDAQGRPATVTTVIGGVTLMTRHSYDSTSGRLDTLTYPATYGTTPLRVRHHYDRGRLVRLSDADTYGTYWQLNAVDSFGQVTDETLGNGVRVATAHDAVTGRMTSRTAGPGGGTAHQNLGYAWDAVGNLSMREERNRGVQEQFFYDNHDRLDYVTRGGAVVLDLAYDATGNLTYKSDVGQYRYDTTRKQAVVAAGSNTYAYDANGAVVNASGTTINWLSYGLPSQLTHPNGNYAAFYYGPDRARYRQVARAAGVLTETLYAVGGLYERVTTSSVTSYRHYIVADGRRVAVQKRQAGAPTTTVYLLQDHLGSVDGFTSTSGALLSRNFHAPHGARRSGNWLGSAPTTAEWQQIQSATPRGYTDHEHLDNVGIVHMNGRVYDPVLGRFLSPDPVVQAPYDTQGLNRYAYVRNNPLRYTDPSGFCYSAQPGSDQQAQPCIEQIFVEAPRRVTEWQFGLPTNWAERMAGFGALPGAEPLPAREVAQGPIEEVIVPGTRLPELPPASIDASMYALVPNFAPYVRDFLRSPYFTDFLLLGVLALLEPTPAGELALASQAAASTGRALVPYYPSANGFIGPTSQVTLKRGALIDRFGGSPYSQFFSPVGTPMQARSLPSLTATQPLRTFEVMAPIQVEAGRVAPWFGQLGLGTQYRSPATLGELLERQLIRELGP